MYYDYREKYSVVFLETMSMLPKQGARGKMDNDDVATSLPYLSDCINLLTRS